MTEFLSEQAITLWGPFAFIVIMLTVILVILGMQYLSRQRTYEARDEKRTAMFMDAVNRFIITTSDNNDAINGLKQEMIPLIRDMHYTILKMNERL